METNNTTLASSREAIIDTLRKDILSMQGFLAPSPERAQVNMGKLCQAFPNGVFPTAAIHEFISRSPESAAASIAFVSALTGTVAGGAGACIWVRQSNRVFPPALLPYGLRPEQIVFITTKTAADTLSATEEALKATGVSAVITEVAELDLRASRRLLLAVEKSHATGFILRHRPRYMGITAAAARWKVEQAPSRLSRQGMPGLGHPAWTVTLEKVKNGRTLTAQLAWLADHFCDIPAATTGRQLSLHRKAG